MLRQSEHFVPNDDGWLLHLERATDSEAFDPGLPPVAIVPGYGMNAFIFGFHPRGTSLVRALAEAGHEVWSLNLRAQGASRAQSKRPPGPSLRAYADVDLTAGLRGVLARTDTDRDKIHVIGCSLGGSIAYAHLALRAEHQVASLVTVGSPLRWVDVHPALSIAMKSPRLAGIVRVRGVARFARLAMPAVTRMPSVLSMYMNTDNVDLHALPQLLKTVEDPHPRVNRDLAMWVNAGDMVLRGVDITAGLGSIDLPLMVVVSNRDGIVPGPVALSVLDAWGGNNIDVLTVGDEDRWYAHADLFVGNDAPSDVFAPLSAWLAARE